MGTIKSFAATELVNSTNSTLPIETAESGFCTCQRLELSYNTWKPLVGHSYLVESYTDSVLHHLMCLIISYPEKKYWVVCFLLHQLVLTLLIWTAANRENRSIIYECPAENILTHLFAIPTMDASMF